MKQRTVHLLRFYLTTVALFLAAKLVFMLCYRSSHAFSLADVADVTLHGLSLDLSTALYFLFLPLLGVMTSLWVKVPAALTKAYRLLVAIVFALAFVADTSLYEFWQFKLDASCLQYLDSPETAMASVSKGYLAVRAALVAVLTVAIYWLYGRCHRPPTLRPDKSALHRSSLQPSPSPQKPSLRRRLGETVLCLLLLPLMVIGVRGGLDESTTNIGQVYFSGNQFLNHSAVNPVFSFLASLGKSGDYIVGYDYYDDAECRLLTDGIFSAESIHPDTLLNTRRPNIVIVIMESAGAQFTRMGGHSDIMPRLNGMMDEGVSFSECYANSWRTDKGVVSILSGYPAFPITSVMKVPEKSRKLPSIAASLSAEGYDCSFLYGGDINFTNMRSYVMASGYAHLQWKADYPLREQRSAQWGVRDDLMFAHLLQSIRQERSDHWMKTLLTLSSHEPWDVPTQRLDDKVYNAFNYLDSCLGTFVDSLRQSPAWDNLLLVVLPDHGYRYRGIDETTRLYNHVPLVWTGGAVREPRTVSRLCNQSDLAATLLGQMGIAHRTFAFSRDIMSRDTLRPMAWHTYNNGVTVFDTTAFVAFDLDAQQVIAREGNETEDLLRRGKALLQLTSHDLKEK